MTAGNRAGSTTAASAQTALADGAAHCLPQRWHGTDSGGSGGKAAATPQQVPDGIRDVYDGLAKDPVANAAGMASLRLQWPSLGKEPVPLKISQRFQVASSKVQVAFRQKDTLINQIVRWETQIAEAKTKLVTVTVELADAQTELAEVERSMAHSAPMSGDVPVDNLANDLSFLAVQELEDASDARKEYDEIQLAHKQLADRCKALASRVRPPQPNLGGGTGTGASTAAAASTAATAGATGGAAAANAHMQVDK